MVTSNQPNSASRRACRESRPVESVEEIVPSGCYRVFALPASHTVTDDVIISDMRGTPYLLSHDSTTPSPIGQDILDLLGMAFEPSQDISWHTASELHQLLYGSTEPVGTPV